MKSAKQDLNILQPLIDFMNGVERDISSWFSLSLGGYGLSGDSQIVFSYTSQRPTFFADGTFSDSPSTCVEKIIDLMPLEQVTEQVVVDALVKANEFLEGEL